jgi:HD-like signal output (HDOD) protein
MTDIVDKERIIQELLLLQPIDIPVFHEVALRLQQMMTDHSYRTEDAIKLVNEDAALAAEMLRQANTAYNSGKTPITTIKNDALAKVGPYITC